MSYEMRRAARMAIGEMRGVPERAGLRFADGQVELRSRPDGTGGTAFEWNGYASVYNTGFEMWDQNGEPFEEWVAPGAFRRSLANPALDVPFLIGHNSAGIPLARTKGGGGTMRLAEDGHGLHVNVPAMDGRREEVRALASAVERGDMDEMSLAFICNRQQWDDQWERRGILEADIHRGDVCAVTHGANPATAGSWMAAVEQLSFRRPVAIGTPAPLLELLSVPQAERDKAKAAGNSLPDGSYPINNVAQLHSAAVLAASHHGDWKAAQALIRRRAKELGVDVTTLPGFGEEKSSGMPMELRASHAPMTGTHSHPHPAYGAQGGDETHEHEHTHDGDASHGHSHESHADGRPLERRSSAADNVDTASAPDFAVPDGVTLKGCKTCQGSGNLPHPVTGAPGRQCPSCNGTGAVVTVDDSTGIPGPEVQLSAKRRLELRMRELEMEELAVQG